MQLKRSFQGLKLASDENLEDHLRKRKFDDLVTKLKAANVEISERDAIERNY